MSPFPWDGADGALGRHLSVTLVLQHSGQHMRALGGVHLAQRRSCSSSILVWWTGVVANGHAGSALPPTRTAATTCSGLAVIVNRPHNSHTHCTTIGQSNKLFPGRHKRARAWSSSCCEAVPPLRVYTRGEGNFIRTCCIGQISGKYSPSLLPQNFLISARVMQRSRAGDFLGVHEGYAKVSQGSALAVRDKPRATELEEAIGFCSS